MSRPRDVAAASRVFAEKGYTRVDPPVVQPADVVIDLLGDAVRSDAYIFTDPGGAEVCLRPDFTLAACRAFLMGKTKAKGATRLWYDGTVYRYPAPGAAKPAEQRHAGVELLGAADKEAADIEVLSLALSALRAAGVDDVRVRFGDLSLFSALVEGLELPREWQGRLRRHFTRPDDFARLLQRLGKGAKGEGPRALVKALGTLTETEARDVIADVLSLADIETVGSRTLDEIVERLLEQAADASALTLGPQTVALIERFLAISGPPSTALAKLRDFAASAGLDLGAALARLERRVALMGEAGLDLKLVDFATSFGRRIGYYTGFIFSLERGRGARAVALASGGRYDTLLRALGSARDVPAVGAALFCDAIVEAR